MKIKKHTRTGTERSSAIDQMIEKIGGGAGGARKRLKIKTDVKGKIDRTKLRIKTFRSLPKELQKQVVTDNGKIAMSKVRSKIDNLKGKAKPSIEQRRTLKKLSELAALGGGIVLAGATAASLSKAVLVPAFKKQSEKNSQKRKKREELKIKKKDGK